MRIIKLSPKDDEMATREEVTRYVTETLLRKTRYGRFYISWAKRNMPDIRRGTLLIFSYSTECMYAARADGEVVIEGRKNLRAYIPLAMETVERIEGWLADYEKELRAQRLTRVSVRANRHWPKLPDSCDAFTGEYFEISEHMAPLHEDEYASLKIELEDAMRLLYADAGEELGYWGRYYLRSIETHGGLTTAIRMLAPRRSDKIHAGLQRLIAARRAHELSVEAIALKPEFKALFTQAERDEAARRLKCIPAPRRKAVPPEENFPETVSPSEHYVEGARKKVWVNAFERSRKARRACLAHHGYACKVCGIEFVETYGKLGFRFIHVHHKQPLGVRLRKYKVRPKIDLTPVCPNCHAMLHAQQPPLTVPQLRRIWQAQRSATKAVG